MAATLLDVASSAGVSTSTVSRYLSGQLRLTDTTERRIQQAIEELGYIPNASARRLAGGRTGIIGLVLPGMANPFFASFADSVAEAALGQDLSVLLCATRDSKQNEERYTDLLAARAVDGLIYLGMYRTNKRLTRTIAEGLPVVVVDETIDGAAEASSITVDNFSGAYQATQHLITNGHREIAYVGGPSELMTERERRRGYTAAMGAAGLAMDPEQMLSGPYSESFGASVLPHLLTRTPRPTALFCASDYTALGVLSTVDMYGLRVPDDLAIVGFDDAPITQYTRPRLTTVRQPVAALAHGAVELLNERIMDPDRPVRRVTLPVELIIRDSSRAQTS